MVAIGPNPTYFPVLSNCVALIRRDLQVYGSAWLPCQGVRRRSCSDEATPGRLQSWRTSGCQRPLVVNSTRTLAWWVLYCRK